MGHYDVEREESEAEAAGKPTAVPDMTPREALRLIRERCPARSWNVVLESRIFQYSARFEGYSYEEPVREPAIVFVCTVWHSGEKPTLRVEGASLREAVEKVLPRLPPVPAETSLQLMTLEGSRDA